MDPVYLFWLYTIGALVGGGIIGAILYRNLTPSAKKANNLKAELDEARLEMESYKASVNNHFDKTAELVNELTQDYVKVYKHLAEGAQALGDGRDFTNVLEQHQGKVLISVDDEKTAQDTIISEVPTDTRDTQQEPLDLLNEDLAQESASGSGVEVDTKGEVPESLESLAEQVEKKDPVIDVEKPVSKVLNA